MCYSNSSPAQHDRGLKKVPRNFMNIVAHAVLAMLDLLLITLSQNSNDKARLAMES